MPTCPHCRHHFRVLEDEDDGQHGCPRCGYGGDEPAGCDYCGQRLDDNEHYPYCSSQCAVKAETE